MRQSRNLILVVAHQAAATIESVLRHLPCACSDVDQTDVLVIDDASVDGTYETSKAIANGGNLPLPIRVLRNGRPQGRGGSEKLGFHFAIQHGYEVVVVVDPLASYNLESFAALSKGLTHPGTAAVVGSAVSDGPELSGDASTVNPARVKRSKIVRSRLWTRLYNRMLRTELTDFHSGLRAYSVRALQTIPFEYNSNGTCFGLEVLIQFLIAGMSILEVPVNVHGKVSNRYRWIDNWRLFRCSLQARLQESSLFYDRKFDCAPVSLSQYTPKFDFSSPHLFALDTARRDARVLDLGCGTGYVGAALKEKKNCQVTGVDARPLRAPSLDKFVLRNLDNGLSGIPVEQHDYVLLLDVIEHLANPEQFLDELRRRLSLNPEAELIISTGNVAFCVTRLMLLLGKFNYGKRGILDLTHTRLFTFFSMKNVLVQSGFDVFQTVGIPAPFPLALGHNVVSRCLLAWNTLLVRVWPGLFAYQMVMRAKARPTLSTLLKAAEDASCDGDESVPALGAVG